MTVVHPIALTGLCDPFPAVLAERLEHPIPFDAAAVSGYIKNNRELAMRLQCTLGTGRCTFYTCDLTYEYVRLNADYTT